MNRQRQRAPGTGPQAPQAGNGIRNGVCRAVACWRRVVLLCLLSLYLPFAAGWHLGDQPLPPGELDRAFELEAYHLLTQRLGLDATRYVRVTRFGNTILLTGTARSAAERAQVEELLLEVAGIRRETPDSAVVVPRRSRDCGDRPVLGNARRRQIVRGGEDCSALRAEDEAPATGRLYNQLGNAAADPDRELAAADLLAARARYALVEAGYPQALDRERMRLASQGSLLYVLLRPDARLQEQVRAVLLRLPGVTDVQFYTG